MIRGTAAPKRLLATVLFTDIVRSTETAAELGDRRWREVVRAHHAFVRRALKHFGGREVDTAGDGFLATFGRPADAIRCASAITAGVRRLGLEVRAGVHTGEVEQEGPKVGGIAVHIGARVAAQAQGGEVLVSSTVRDLVTGAGIEFEDRGEYALKGVPGDWRLYAVSGGAGVELPPSLGATLPAPGVPAQRGRARFGRRHVAVAAAILLLIGAGAAFALHSLQRAGLAPVSNGVALLDPQSGQIRLATPVGRSPAGVAVGGGSVWVINTKDSTLSRIDERSGVVSGEPLAVGGIPSSVAFGAGRVWIGVGYGAQPGQGALVVRIDPGTYEVDRQISVGGAQGIAFDPDVGGSVWVADPIDNEVVRIDATTLAASVLPAGSGASAVASGAGGVWVANTLDRSIWRLNPGDGAVVARIPLRAPPTAVAVGGGSVWVASLSGNLVTRIDAATGQIQDEIEVPAGPDALSFGGGAVWVACGGAEKVVSIDPASERLRTFALGDTEPTGIAWSNLGVWLALSPRAS